MRLLLKKKKRWLPNSKKGNDKRKKGRRKKNVSESKLRRNVIRRRLKKPRLSDLLRKRPARYRNKKRKKNVKLN